MLLVPSNTDDPGQSIHRGCGSLGQREVSHQQNEKTMHRQEEALKQSVPSFPQQRLEDHE